jgi:hypothetical protein
MMLITVSCSEEGMLTRVGAATALLHPVLEHLVFQTKACRIDWILRVATNEPFSVSP